MKYKYMLFDWDGTLVKTLDVWVEAYKHISIKLGANVSGMTDGEVAKIFFGKLGDGFKNFGIKDSIRAYDQVKNFVDKNVNSAKLYPKVLYTFKKLKEFGLRIALHTTSNRNLIYPLIQNNNLENYFDIILTMDDVVNSKPDPEVIIKELKFFKAKPEEALIIGDSDSDIKAGKNSGVDTVLFYPPENEKFYELEFLMRNKPKFVIHDLIELLKIVQ